MHVLLVDDDEAVLRAYARTIAGFGHKVSCAPNGATALDLIRRASFNVIISDISMPGLDGVELLRLVRESDLDVPVILITGTPTVDTAAQAVERGALRYLTKPVDPLLLREVIQKAIDLHDLAKLKRRALQLLGRTDTQVGDRSGLEVKLDAAIRGLWMAYQPIVAWSSREVVGYEALLRSGEPTMPTPGAILGAAERLGRLQELGRRIRGHIAETMSSPCFSSPVFVNLHAQDLLDDSLYTPTSPLTSFASRTILEITERVSLDAVSDVRDRVSVLRRLGYRIAVDDLGAGYAGLTSVARLDPDFVKLDMSLVRDIHLEPKKQLLVRSMAALCNDMGMRVVVEGVETTQELNTLTELGCELFQGYLFARPAEQLPAVAWETIGPPALARRGS